jgi:hypothetical protein
MWLKPYNIGICWKGLWISFHVILLFSKSFHFWASFITLCNFLKIPSVLKELRYIYDHNSDLWTESRSPPVDWITVARWPDIFDFNEFMTIFKLTNNLHSIGKYLKFQIGPVHKSGIMKSHDRNRRYRSTMVIMLLFKHNTVLAHFRNPRLLHGYDILDARLVLGNYHGQDWNGNILRTRTMIENIWFPVRLTDAYDNFIMAGGSASLKHAGTVVYYYDTPRS